MKLYEPRMPIDFNQLTRQGMSLDECLQFVKHIDDGTFEPLTKEEWLGHMLNYYRKHLVVVQETLDNLNRFNDNENK